MNKGSYPRMCSARKTLLKSARQGFLAYAIFMLLGCAGYVPYYEQQAPVQRQYGPSKPNYIGDDPCNEQGYDTQACAKYKNYLQN